MDIAAYISELLEHQDKLAVPGLGTFYRSRLDGYYNKEQQQFYPPSLQLQLDTELQEDDGKLVAAMTADKQMTASTARYHIDKYVSGILELAATEIVPLGDLGIFSMRRNQLAFMPKKLNNNNELFYGLAPVRLRRSKAEATSTPKRTPVMPYNEKPSAFTAALLRGEPMPGKPLSSVNDPKPKETEVEPEDEAEDKKPARISTWVLVVALVILLSGVALICAYKFNPALFNRFRGQTETPPVTTDDDKRRARMISDSIQHAIEAQKNIGLTPTVDSATKSKILAPETPRDTFGIVVGKFSDIAGAKKEYDRYRYTGLPVELRKNPVTDPNPFQLVVATYFVADSANAHLSGWKNKLKLQDVFVQIYPYKKPK